MKKIAIVLENGFEADMPKKLKSYLKGNKIKWKLFDMRGVFWPENKKSTVDFFSGLPEGQLFILETVFVKFQQLELMIELLFALKHKKFTVKIIHPFLAQEFLKFYNESESSITPDELHDKVGKEFETATTTEQEGEIYDKIINGFKREMNKKFLSVLKHHNIYFVRSYLISNPDEILLKTLSDIKKHLNP